MREFGDETSWESVRKDLRYTLSTLRASGEHAQEAKAVHALLQRWDEVSARWSEAEDGVVEAHAHVAWCDAALDEAVESFARELLHAARGERGDARFAAYFPEAPGEITRMGLEAELERTARFREVAKRVAPSKPEGRCLDALDASRERGLAAIEQRKRAVQAEALERLAVRQFKDDANRVRRDVYNRLQRHGLDQGRGAGYADRFFAVTPKRVKPKSAKPAVEKPA